MHSQDSPEDELIKYLYGKHEIFKPFIDGKRSLRFTDLSHYMRLENILMRDNELSKTFVATDSDIKIRVYANGNLVAGDGIIGAKFTLPLENHYCLCLSNKRNDPKLFSRFKADVCLGIKVNELVSFLELVGNHYSAFSIKHGHVSYYKKNEPPPVNDNDLVFYKPYKFRIEDEYRVAIKIKKKYFVTDSGARVPCFIEGESMHMFLDTQTPTPCEMYLHEVYIRQNA